MPQIRQDVGEEISTPPRYFHSDSHALQNLKDSRSPPSRTTRASSLKGRQQIFLYRAWRDGGLPSEGERVALHRGEVEAYLRDRGYTRYKVMRKWLPMRSHPPTEEVVLFVRLCADLLRDKIPLDEAIRLLKDEMRHPRLRGAMEEILWDLREGKSGQEVFGRHQEVLGRFPAQMLALASASDSLPEVFESAAKFIERRRDFRKNLKSALLMPTITLTVLFAAVVFYVGYIFPEMAVMYKRFDIPLPPLTQATVAVSSFARTHLAYLLALTGICVIICSRYFLTRTGRVTKDRWLLRLPILGPLFQKASIEIWCRVFHALYGGTAGSVEAVKIASEACQNLYVEEQIKSRSIPLVEKHGARLVDALEKASVFPENALTRLRTGEVSGALKRASLQVANYYEKDSNYRARAVIDWIQVAVALLITIVMTVLTIISSETAVIQPQIPGMKPSTSISALQ